MQENEFVKMLELAKVQPSSAKNYVKAIRELINDTGENPSIDHLKYFIIQKSRKRQAWVKYAIKHYLQFIGRGEDYKSLDKAKILPPIRHKNFLAKYQIEEILNYIDNERHKVIGIIQFYTGARASEIITIDKRRIKEEILGGNKIQKITLSGKGQKPRYIYLSQPIWKLLMPYIGKCRIYPLLEKDNLGLMLGGEPIPYISFWTRVETEYHNYLASLKKAAIKCGINPGTHDLRRSFAQLVRQDTGDIFKVQKALGHSSITQTIKYFDDKEAEVADTMLKFQEGI